MIKEKKLLQIQENVCAEREDIYSSDIPGNGPEMFLVTNRRFIYISSSSSDAEIMSISLSDIIALRFLMSPIKRHVASLILMFYIAGLSVWFFISDTFTLFHTVAVILICFIVCIMLIKLFRNSKSILIYLKGMFRPIQLKFHGSKDVFINLCKDITYYKSLIEDKKIETE